MQTSFLLPFIFLIFHQLPSVFGVSDENICDPSLQCQYCCRDKMCKSEADCKGNFQPFVIAGAVAGGLVGLFILRKAYVWYQAKNAKANPRNAKKQGSARSRWRSRSRSKTPKEKKEKKEKASKSSKSSKAKATKYTEKEELYLQVDNESVISPDITIKVEGAKEEESQPSSKIKSDPKIKSKAEVEDPDQDALVAEKKDMKSSKADPKKDMKSSAGHWTSKKDDGKSSKSNKDKEKEKDKKGGSGKDKGRSSRSTSTNKDRGSSQKRDVSKGKSKGDEMRSSRRSESKK